jgi:catechol 2,3-dioxygenase-like lactoylglutathione lyase family enzyme
MQRPESSLDSLSNRVAKLEVQNRRFKKAAIAALVLAVATVTTGQMRTEGPKRPRIYAIQNITLLSSDAPDALRLYRSLSKLDVPCLSCGDSMEDTVVFSSGQEVRVLPMPQTAPADLVVNIRFGVDNIEVLKKYLNANHVEFKESKGPDKETGDIVSMVDPEGHAISFAKQRKNVGVKDHTNRIIHTGFVVKDRAVMDKFYKDILGFKLYWSGGMKDGETNWVDMQVPDGTDWVEYMLNIPPDADKRTLGVMNHFALGVPSVKTAAIQLEKAGVTFMNAPKVGKDGKWQLNLYDPDATRVELMEFAPVEKPCCSEFTGNQPKP